MKDKIDAEQRAILDSYSCLNKEVWFKDKIGPGAPPERWCVGVVEDEVSVICDDYKHVLQRIRLSQNARWDGCEYAYRAGYYTWSADLTRVVWGQYHQLVSEQEYRILIQKAHEKGWPILP